MEWLAAGPLEAEYSLPNGNPVQVIKNVLSNPALTDEDRQQLGRNLFQRLNLLQAADQEASAKADAAFKAEAEAADRDLTSMLLRGKLTVGKIDEAVRLRGLNPSRATALMEKLSSGPGGDDDRERFKVESNLLAYTSGEIEDNPRLSWSTKLALVTKLESKMQGWPDSNTSQEARRRIDNKLGIVPGVMNALLTPDEIKARGIAQTMWYDRMAALPPEQREANAIPVAEAVISEYVNQQNAQKRQRSVQALIAKAKKDMTESKPGTKKYETAKTELAARQAELAQIQGRTQ